MKILTRYLLSVLIKNFLTGLALCTLLFLVFDFFDRIDNLLAENAGLWLIIQYFLFKIPLMISLMLPVAVMFTTLFSFGLLSKNSEITAMRAAGIPIRKLAKPLVGFSLCLSVFSILLNELIVPATERRQREIYNIDIRQKDKRGGYSQSFFWWRRADTFYSSNTFDSRTNRLMNLSAFELNKDWRAEKRIDSNETFYIDPVVGWSMKGVKTFRFERNTINVASEPSLPLPIPEHPQDFYDVKAEPFSMSFLELRDFIKQQQSNGVPVNDYISDLYSKLAFPLVTLITAMVVLPFSLLPARSGSMAVSVLAAVIIAFAYYAVDSFSVAMGRAEILPPLVAAWTANIVMGAVALILNLGAESPN